MAVTPVDILNLGNRRNQQGGANGTAPQTDIEKINRQEQQIQSLNRQVEVGLGSKIDNVMSDRDKQLYVDGLDDNDWNLMQKYKSEGYGFMASKTLLENKKKLQDPYQNGILKYKDYDAKEKYYNKTGIDIDPDSALGKTALFLQKIGFDEQYGNPLNKLASQYNERYANERQAVDEVMDDEEANSLEKIGWWLQRTLMSAESSVINAIGNIGNMAQGVADIEQSAVSSALDNAILGLDTDANFYRKEDRRLDEYAWQGVRGGADLLFRAMSPGVMASFTAVGETKAGGEILDLGDKAVRWTVEQGLKLPGIKQYYNSLDEQGKEDMLDSLTTGAYMLIMKKLGKEYDRFKNETKPGQWISQQETYLKNTRNLFKKSLEEGVKGAKEQIGREGVNRSVATDMYNGETGKISGRYGPEGEVGIKKEAGRVVQAGLDAFKNTFQEGVRQSNEYNASKRGGTLAKATEVTGTQPTEPTTTVGKPTVGNKIVDGAKSIWDTTITGLTPEERIRIQNDPFVKEKTSKALAMIQEAGMPMEEAFITEQLYNEIGDKIISVFNEWENKLNETSPIYNTIRNLNTAYDLSASLPEITELLNKNDITVGPGGVLDFTNSKFVSEADMRSVQRVMDMINRDLSGIITPRQYLNLRTKISELAKYTTVDASRGQSLIRQIRHTMNETAHKQIPGLTDADKITNKRIKELEELKEGWIYKGGDRKGEIRNNFYSIIKNLTGHNRKVMLQRLEKYYPGVSEEIEAIHLTEKIVKAYNKAPQLIRTLGLSGAVGGGLIQGGLVGTLLGLLAGELISTGFINPASKRARKKAIDKLISELSPEAQRKLEIIAVKQMQAKELSKEETAVLEKVVEIMAKEQDKFFNEKAIKEREERTKNDQNQLGYHPDVADEKGNVKLGIGKAISPKKSYKSKKLKQVTEINLKDTNKPADVKVSEIQNELGIDQEVAQEIKTTIDEFLDMIGIDEEGMTNARNVDYTKFSKKALQELLEDKDIPKIEKKKIEQALERAIKDEVLASESDLDREYAYKIHKLQEEEQRIGKVGKNKVGKEYADKQMRDWEKKKEKLIKAMQEDYNLDQFKATDKYAELEAKPIDFINSYTKTKGFRQASAEREILDKLKAGWNSQPTFIRNMDENQLMQRKNLLDNVELQNGYNMKTEEYNDRYELKENGKIVDRGSIKYGEDGTIEVIAQSMDGLINSGLINYLPDDAIIKISGEDLRATVGDLRASGNEALADITAYHGGGAKFDKFDLSFQGSGEGGSIHGWGVYVAKSRDTSMKYAKMGMTQGTDGLISINNKVVPESVKYKGQELTNRSHANANIKGDVTDNQFVNEFIKTIANESLQYQGEDIKKRFDWRKNYQLTEILPKEIATEENRIKNDSWRVAEKRREDSIQRAKDRIEKLKQAIEEIKKIELKDFSVEFGKGYLYEVEIPDPAKKDTPTGKNYLDEDEWVSMKAVREIAKKVKESGQEVGEEKGNPRGIDSMVKRYEGPEGIKGINLYHILQTTLGSKKNASKFLESLGYDGIHAIGNRDGEIYVIFNENNVHIKNVEPMQGGQSGPLADYVTGGQRVYKAEDVTEETGITNPYHYQKLSKKITPEEKEKGLQLWNDATHLGEGRSAFTKRDEARKIFIVQTLQQGYIEALGLDPLEVKKEMEKRPINGNKLQNWQESVNVLAEDEIDSRIGSDLIAQNVQKVINKSALESFVKKVSGTPVNSNDLGDIIKTVLAIDSNQDYSLLEYLFMDETDKRLIIDGDVARGVYFSDTDEIFVSRDFPLTISHETFHYLDYLRGREVSGKYGALSDRSINLSNATPEARQFRRDFSDFVTELVFQIPEHLANDKTGPNKGIPGMYWSRRTEVFARFGSAFVDRVERSVNGGPLDEIKGAHKDVFTEENMADFVNLLQRHSKLKREGKLKDPHDVELTGTSHKDSMADFIQKSLFESEPEKPKMTLDEAWKRFNKERAKLSDIGNDIARDHPYSRYRLLYVAGETYDPNIETWVSNFNKMEETSIKKSMTKRELVRLFDGLKMFFQEEGVKEAMKDPNFKNEHLADQLIKLKDAVERHPLDIPEKLKSEPYLGPLRRYLWEMPGINVDMLWKTYDPDIIERMTNLEKKYPNTPTRNELYKTKELIDNYIKNVDEDIQIEGTFDDVGIKFLIDKARYRKDNHGEISSYDKKQIQKLGEETAQLLDNRLAELNFRYDDGASGKRARDMTKQEFKDEMDITEKRLAEWNEIKEDFFYQLGKTYDTDVDKWHANMKKVFKEYAKQYDGFKGIKRYENILGKSGLQGLKTKVNELEKYIEKGSVYKGQDRKQTDIFIMGLENRLDELKAQGVEEAVTDLVALSSMSVENFRKQMFNFGGKSPMPSIAITDPNVPHESFGPLTLVFGRETVDPEVNPENRIYGSDAYTPMFPGTKEVRSPKFSEFRTLLYNERPNLKFDTIGSNTYDEYMKEVNKFLKRIEDTAPGEVRSDEAFDAWLDHLKYSKDSIKKIIKYIKENPDIIGTQQVIPARYFMGNPKELTNLEIMMMADEITDALMKDPVMQETYVVDGVREDVYRFIEDRRKDGPKAIVEKIAMEYTGDEDGIRDIVSKYFTKEAPKDRPVTPENVLEAMRGMPETNRDVNPGEYKDMIGIVGSKMKTIEDVRKKNFAKTFHGAWESGDLGDLESRYNTLIETIREEAMMDAKQMKEIIKETYNTDVDKFKEAIEPYIPYDNISEDALKKILQRMVDVIEQGKKIPIRFSEGKPNRIVDLTKEVQYILVPRSQKAVVDGAVKGTPLEGKVIPYTPNENGNPRGKEIKKLQKKYGNIFFSMGGVIMPIAMLYLMMEQEEGQA